MDVVRPGPRNGVGLARDPLVGVLGTSMDVVCPGARYEVGLARDPPILKFYGSSRRPHAFSL